MEFAFGKRSVFRPGWEKRPDFSFWIGHHEVMTPFILLYEVGIVSGFFAFGSDGFFYLQPASGQLIKEIEFHFELRTICPLLFF